MSTNHLLIEFYQNNFDQDSESEYEDVEIVEEVLDDSEEEDSDEI